MKKLYSEASWGQRTKRMLALQRRREQGRRPSRWQHGDEIDVVVPAPTNFSLVENVGDVLRFVEEVERHARAGRNIRLDFRRIDVLTPDAIALLVAKSRERLTNSPATVRASKPKKESLRRTWNDCGLTDVFQSSDRDELPEQRGKIIMKSMVKTNPEAALFLREFAEARIEISDDAHWLSVQTVLLECMANTVNHAQGESREEDAEPTEPWYAAVYCDEASGTAKFTFLDTGVGILESLRKKPPFVEALMMKTTAGHMVLKDVFAGKITSATGLKHRGEGLPEIFNIAVHDREIDRLVVVTNEAYADAVASKYTSLSPARLNGTVIYWEKIGRWKT